MFHRPNFLLFTFYFLLKLCYNISVKRYALIGCDIGYTRSPFVHGEICRLAGADTEYGVLDFPPEELPERIRYLRENYDGFNVTKPYKADVIKYLDGLDIIAESIGAANTVARTADGKLFGYNTDIAGFVGSLEYHGIGLCGKRVLILGAGGAARAAIVALGGLSEVKIWNRTYETALRLTETAREWKMEGRELGITAVKELPSDCYAIINCTSAGLHNQHTARNESQMTKNKIKSIHRPQTTDHQPPIKDDCPLPRDFEFGAGQVAIDLIYNPRETEFLRRAKAAGLKTANGAAMLFYQALRAQGIWQGAAIDASEAENIIEWV